MGETILLELEGFRLPETSGFRREYTRPEKTRTEHYLQRFDARTLFYDCVWLAERNRFLFTAPRLLNLWPLMRDGLRVDGKKHRRVKRQIMERCELIEVRQEDTMPEIDLLVVAGSSLVAFSAASFVVFVSDVVSLVAASRNHDEASVLPEEKLRINDS